MTEIQDILVTEMCRRQWDHADLARESQSSRMLLSFWLKQHNPTVPLPEACRALAAALEIDPDRMLQAAGY
jgi:hypothetical protein